MKLDFRKHDKIVYRRYFKHIHITFCFLNLFWDSKRSLRLFINDLLQKCNHLKGPVYFISNDYHIPGFCFEVVSDLFEASKNIFKLIDFLLHKSIAHNIFITRGQRVTGHSTKEIIRVIVWPRKNSSGAKQLNALNVAVLELSGWFPIFGELSVKPVTKK